MRAFTRKIRRVPLLVLGLSLCVPAAGRAQRWTLLDGLGYGAAGVGVGVLVGWDQEIGGAYQIIALTTAAGLAVGGVIGHRADTRLARGEPLSDGHRAAVVVGSVLAGAGAGALASVAFINGEGKGTFLGSDEATFMALSVGGAAVGAALTWWSRDALRPGGVAVSPAVSPEGGVGVRVRVGF